jgi:hypothetical protein
MQNVQEPETRKMVEAYHEGYITLNELVEELEWYWDKKIYKGTKTPIVKRTGVLMTEIVEEDG